MSIVTNIDDGDWLSSTVHMVETVMERHGFVDDKLQRELSAPQQNAKRRDWVKALIATLKLQKAA